MNSRRVLTALFLGCGLAAAVGLTLRSTHVAAAEADLPPGAAAEWWAAVKESLEPGGGVRSIGDGASDWTLTGEAAVDDFSLSVATAGDVNGDGYADVVVGAPGYGTFQGRVYLYAGSPGGLSATPIFTDTAEGIDSYFGFSVAAAGDVDGDGYGDVVVGAPGYGTFQGRVYLYAGGPGGLAPTPIFTATGEETMDDFGTSVAAAGDVNGDGYGDVVVGAPGYGTFQGRA